MSYDNKDEDILNYGIELEHTHNFSDDFLLLSNISYVKAKYKNTKKELIGYAPFLANIALSYKPYSNFSTSLKIRSISSKKRDDTDTRDKFKSITTSDLTFKYLPLFVKNLDTSFGIKNITNEDIKYPSLKETYSDDYFIKKRYFFIGAEYKF
jgi:outer membrane receptor for ferrienterochelin and colicin